VPSYTLLGQSALSGIFIGALYGLLGLGLTLCWGMLRQINLAHFALVFLGAYLTYQLGAAGMDPLASLALIAPAFFLFGVALHWLLARFKVNALNTLLVTFGFTVMLESLIQWIWSADFRRLESHYGDVKWKVGELFVPLPELLTLGLAVSLALAGCATRTSGKRCVPPQRTRRSPPRSASTRSCFRSCSRGCAPLSPR
jgi:branched-chain amino acid transport system permease protein